MFGFLQLVRMYNIVHVPCEVRVHMFCYLVITNQAIGIEICNGDVFGPHIFQGINITILLSLQGYILNLRDAS